MPLPRAGYAIIRAIRHLRRQKSAWLPPRVTTRHAAYGRCRHIIRRLIYALCATCAAAAYRHATCRVTADRRSLLSYISSSSHHLMFICYCHEYTTPPESRYLLLSLMICISSLPRLPLHGGLLLFVICLYDISSHYVRHYIESYAALPLDGEPFLYAY